MRSGSVYEKNRWMFSLQRLFHKDDKLLSLLEISALEARASVQALLTASKSPDASEAARDVAYSRLKDREITARITQEVYSTFIAALEAEDVQDLSNVLYKIPKIADKYEERIRACPEFARGINFSAQLTFADQATDVLAQLVQSLKHGLHLEEVRALNDRLQSIEEDADKHMLTLYRDLYTGKHQAVQAIVLKDLYELLEKLIDRCCDAGNIIAHIALKNS